MSTLTESPAWIALAAHHAQIINQPISSLFDQDSQRFVKFSRQLDTILLDFSKQLLDETTLTCLLALARQQNLQDWIRRMFSGDRINTTENRAALHIALRADTPVYFDGVDVMPEVNAVLQQMAGFVAAIHNHTHRGYSGLPIVDVVNIGIGVLISVR